MLSILKFNPHTLAVLSLKRSCIGDEHMIVLNHSIGAFVEMEPELFYKCMICSLFIDKSLKDTSPHKRPVAVVFPVNS